jgi:hypothetical protein
VRLAALCALELMAGLAARTAAPPPSPASSDQEPS